MLRKIDKRNVSAAVFGLTTLGVGSIITAIFASKVPILRNVNPQALTAVRVALGVSGAVKMIAGLAALSYSMRDRGSTSGAEEEVGGSVKQGETDSTTDRDAISSDQLPPQASTNAETEDSISTSSTSSSTETVFSEGEPKPSTLQEAFVKAVMDGNRDEVERLLNEGGVDVNGTAVHGQKHLRLLTIAICRGDVEIIELLLRQEGIVISPDQGDELYVWAQREEQIEVVKPLLEGGVSPSRKGEGSKNFICWVAKRERRFDLIPLLKYRGFDIEANLNGTGEGVGLCGYFFLRDDKEGFKAFVDAGVSLEFLHHFTDKRGDELRSWAFARIGLGESEEDGPLARDESEDLICLEPVFVEARKTLSNAMEKMIAGQLRQGSKSRRKTKT